MYGNMISVYDLKCLLNSLRPIRRGINAHFYAPRKMMFGKYVDTFWVNMMVIWFMSLTMAITLYFDLLKKLLDSFEGITGSIKKLLKRK